MSLRSIDVVFPAALALAASSACNPEPSRAAPGRLEFVDVARAAGLDLTPSCGDPRRWYIVESNGNGAAWIDHDGDGDLDLFVGNGPHIEYVDDGKRLKRLPGGKSRLYRNDGGLKFVDVSSAVGLDRDDWVNGIAAADADNDGDTDLYLACFAGDVYLRNDGGKFVDATSAAGLGNPKWGASAAFGDVDNDGDLDLYVANYCEFDLDAPPDGGKRALVHGVEVGYGPEAENKRGFNLAAPDVFFENLGQGRFRDATADFGFALEKPGCSYGVAIADLNGDGWPEVAVANDVQPTHLFVNDGKGRFRERGIELGFALNHAGQPTGAMALAVDDFDGDGDFDVLRTNFDFEANSLHVNDGKGHFKDQAQAAGLAEASMDKLGWDAGFLDADLDGDLDLLVANGHVYPQSAQIQMGAWKQPTQLFEARGQGGDGPAFVDATARAGAGLAGVHAARGIALGDPDEDGDIDAVVVGIDEPLRLLENRSERRGTWIGVRTRGTDSNRDGFGAVVRVSAGGRTWTRPSRSFTGLYSAQDPRVHFGLGEVESIDWIEVRWPSGRVSRLNDPAPGRYVEMVEPPKEAR